MSSAVAELEAGLQAMQALKAPGVSGSRITSLTALCVANVQSESVLIQKLYTHFKKAPGTHKLGVLYVVDSVTRKWLDQAKQQGQTVNSSAPDGTFAAGVNRVTELIPSLLNDILATAPADQKEKIKKLVDIWEKGQTFPPKLIESFKEKLNAPHPNASTTPPGSPPANILGPQAARSAAPAGQPAIPSSIMETLANLAKQSSAAAAAAPVMPPATVPPAGPYGSSLPPHLMNYQQPPPPHLQMQQQQQPPAHTTPLNPQLPFQMPGAPPMAPSTAAPHFAGLPYGATAPPAPGYPQLQPVQPQPQPQPQLPPNIQQNMLLLQALIAQGISQDQILAILAQATAAQPGGLGGAPVPTAAPHSLVPSVIAAAAAAGQQPQYGGAMPQSNNNMEWSRGGDHGNRSPRGGRGRSRSRSPPYWDAGRGSPRGGHGRRASPSGRDRDRGRGGSGGGGRDPYRQRSPAGRRGGDGSEGSQSGGHGTMVPPTEKWIEHDPSLPAGSIRVLSRTLFVGGVTIGEADLRAIFSRYGEVQTCIVNKEKRHAFVKMYTRRDAEAAKAGMESTRADDSGLRTRWGVGFGPRDCSDYGKGVSVIPIAKLTDADRKWLLTAPWGGSGGQNITSGMVVEEPDIEIGAGVSSKAISRRMQTDRGGINGPRSTRREEELQAQGTLNGGGSGGGGGGGGRPTRRGGRRGGGGGGGNNGAINEDFYNEVSSANSYPLGSAAAAPAPSAATAPFSFAGLTIGPNGIPTFPSGIAFPTDKSG